MLTCDAPRIVEIHDAYAVVELEGYRHTIDRESGRVTGLRPADLDHPQAWAPGDGYRTWVELRHAAGDTMGHADHFATETLLDWLTQLAHRGCYPCKGTGRVVGFGAAHGAPCPASCEEG